ncbi:MAG: molecular chaperone DnaJ [Vicinamibacterales bacterium]
MDLYIVLGLGRTASTADIKRAYRRLARRLHPDINPGDRDAATRFRQIFEAYETLIDPERRHRYDTGQIKSPAAADEAGSYGFTGFDFSGAVRGDPATTFGDLFQDVFIRSATHAHAAVERGADLHARVSLSFEDAWRGCERPVTVTRQERCRTCNGSGSRRIAESRCVACEGTGSVRSVRGHMVFAKNCAHCGGAGQLRQRVCGVCHGQGIEATAETFSVHIPAGIADGAMVRVAGKGHAGVRGGEPGDLFVEVQVQPHRLFRREADDVHITIPIALHEAALGARIEIPTPDGSARLRVPPGTQSGQRVRLRERGAASTRDGRRGDLVVEMRLMLPPALDERSKELLREFGRINGDNVRTDVFRTG